MSAPADIPERDLEDLKVKLHAEVDRLAPEIIALSSFIHAHPETGFNEFQSHDRLTRFAADHGFTVLPHACGLETAFLAEAGTPGAPTAALCCEYDALPVLGHGCGHNIIGAAGMGAATALRGVMGEINGRLLVIGTPAEEGGGGKAILLERGAFDSADIALMVHPAAKDAPRMDTLANQQFHAVFSGQAAHASAAPWEGRNALDAAVLGYMNVAALRQHLPPGDQAHGIFIRGGERPNIVPGETEMHWYIRSKRGAALPGLRKRITACLEAGAMAAGCTVGFSFSDHPYHEMRDNGPLLEAFMENGALLGRTFPEPEPGKGSHGSTDMGNVSVRVASIHPMIGIAGTTAPLHSPEFAAAAISKEGERTLIDAVKIIGMTVLDFWGSSELRQRISEDFSRQTGF